MFIYFKVLRQQFIADGRFRRYLPYAFGEIILVVIGILIALQVNNWNEQRKLNHKETVILKSLLTDLKSAQVQSQRAIENETYALFVLETILKDKSERQALLKDKNLDAILYQAFWNFEVDIPVINSYSDIKNTGKQELITNMEIRKKFNNIDMGINNLISLVKDRSSVQQTHIDEVVVQNLNFVRLLQTDNPSLQINKGKANDFDQLVDAPTNRNRIAMKLELTQSVKSFRQQSHRDIEILINLIEFELKGRQ